MSEDFVPGKFKTPGTQVPKPDGFHRARAHEVTKPVLAFANQVLKVANPDKLPQAEVIGKRLPGLVEGSPVLAQIEWHFDNHPPRPTLGLGPMEGDPFYHMGVTLYLPDTDIAAGEERTCMSKFDYLRDYFRAVAPPTATRKASTTHTVGAPTRSVRTSTSRIAPPYPNKYLAPSSTSSSRIAPLAPSYSSTRFSPPAPPGVSSSSSSYIAPPTGRRYIAPPTGRYTQSLSLGPDRRSAFDSPMHHHFGHPNDWQSRQGSQSQDQSYRQMQQQAQQQATMDSLTPEDSYAPSYTPSMAPRQPAPPRPRVPDEVQDGMPDNTPMSLFLPPQDDDVTDTSFDTEINDDDLSNPADSEDDVQIAADFGAYKRRSGKRKTSSSSSSSSSGHRRHHRHHKKQDQQQQQAQQQDPGGGGSSGGGSSGSGGGQPDDDDDQYDDSGDSFEAEPLPGAFGFDGFGYAAGSASRRFG